MESLLGNPAAQKLIGSLAVDIANGMAPSDLTKAVIHSVITSPGLQIAVGMAVGQGIGSLLGDNLLGGVVGGAVGVTATVFVGVASCVRAAVSRTELAIRSGRLGGHGQLGCQRLYPRRGGGRQHAAGHVGGSGQAIWPGASARRQRGVIGWRLGVGARRRGSVRDPLTATA